MAEAANLTVDFIEEAEGWFVVLDDLTAYGPYPTRQAAEDGLVPLIQQIYEDAVRLALGV